MIELDNISGNSYLIDLDIDGKIIMELDVVGCELVNLILIAHCREQSCEQSCEQDNECPCYIEIKDLITCRATTSSDLLFYTEEKNEVIVYIIKRRI
jgi:hypothetical protein